MKKAISTMMVNNRPPVQHESLAVIPTCIFRGANSESAKQSGFFSGN